MIPHTMRFLPVHSGSTVPYDLSLLLGLHSLWHCLTTGRNTDVLHATKSIFIEMTRQAKGVYQEIGQSLDWFALILARRYLTFNSP